MSPIEKSKDLINKFRNETANSTWYTERCALICVDEIIKELKDVNYNYDMDDRFGETTLSQTVIPYWEEVKKYINTSL